MINELLLQLRNKKILITGGLGFIGSNLAHKCVKLGAHVTIFDNLNPRAGGNLFNISDIRSKIQLSIGDILDFQHLCQRYKFKSSVRVSF